MNVAFVSVCFGDLYTKEYKDYVYPTVNEYCQKYDIDFHLYEKKLDDNRAPQWSKILAVRNHLNEYDWIVWIDADIMIMNHTIDIRDYINQNYKFIITKFEKPKLYDLNTGLFFIKGKSEWSGNFLKEVYFGDNVFVNNPTKLYHEQSSMGRYIENHDVENEILIRDSTIHKTWPMFMPDTEDFLLHPNDGGVQTWIERCKSRYFQKGDFACHVLGRDIEERNEIYKLLSNHVLWHE